MKNRIIVLVVIITIGPIYIFGQYYNFPEIGWKQTYTSYTWTGVHNQVGISTLSFDKDTIFGTQSYFTNGSAHIRNENGKVYRNVYDWQTQDFKEQLEYDFSLEVGDGFQNYFYREVDSLEVISKERIENLLGDSVWQIQLQYQVNWITKDTLTWEEGVGDLSSGLLKTFFPDGGQTHACTLLENNRKLSVNTNNSAYCNCDYAYGIDKDNDGFGNYIPRVAEIDLGFHFNNPSARKNYKVKACDSLKILSDDLRIIYLADEKNCEGNVKNIVGQSGANGGYEFVLNISSYLNGYDIIYLSDQCAWDFAVIHLDPCFENDCDDNNANTNSSQVELPYNGLDDDCNLATLDDDIDKDGFALADDCDDNNPKVNPDQMEIPYNGIDDDCNTETLDDDFDGDGFLAVDDCNENNPDINPGQTEMPYNGVDDDCNPATLDNDLDEDSYLLVDDCDDNNPNVNPGQVEILYNALDDDCDASTLDDDLDEDDFLLVDDCNDNDPNINPDQTELPYNGIDDDCNAETLDDDLDQDGYLAVDDCDDLNSAINPGAEEIANNGIDDNCDGIDLITATYDLADTRLSIFPNPFTDWIKVSLEGQLIYQVSIYNLEGQLMKTAVNTQKINVEELPSGVYLLEVVDLVTKQKVMERIVKGN